MLQQPSSNLVHLHADTLAAVTLADLLSQTSDTPSVLSQDAHGDQNLYEPIATGRYVSRQIRDHVQFIGCDITVAKNVIVESTMSASLWIGLMCKGQWSGQIDGRNLDLRAVDRPVLIGFSDDVDCVDQQCEGAQTAMASFYIEAEFFEDEPGGDPSGSLDHLRRMMTSGATTFAEIPSANLARTLGALLSCPFHGALSDLYFESAALASIVEVGRLTESPGRQAPKPGARDLAIATAARQYIDDNLAEFGGICALAHRLGTNETTLRRHFKSIFGTTIIEYVHAQRLRAAHLLILESDLQIAQIAYRVGYTDPGNFSTAYRRMFGCTPRDTRRGQCTKIL